MYTLDIHRNSFVHLIFTNILYLVIVGALGMCTFIHKAILNETSCVCKSISSGSQDLLSYVATFLAIHFCPLPSHRHQGLEKWIKVSEIMRFSLSPPPFPPINRACGARIVSRPEELREDDVGTGAGLLEIKKIGDEYFTFITECKDPKACTILLRGASKEVLSVSRPWKWG